MCDDDSRTLAYCLDIGFTVVFLSLLTSVCLIFVTWNIIFFAVLLGLRLRLNSDIMCRSVLCSQSSGNRSAGK